MGPFWGSSLSRSVAQANSRAEQGVMTAEEARGRVQELEWKVDKLILVNRALFELIASRLQITETELMDMVNEIDLRDGKLDGRLAIEATSCEKCGRTYSRRHNHCLYCGHVNTAGRAL